MNWTPVFAIVLLIALTSIASGQTNYYGPTTSEPVYSRGLGGVFQGAGQMNLSNSQAAINNQQAYSMAIDNSLKYANAYYERKDIHDQYKQKEYEKRAQSRAAFEAKNRLQPLASGDFDRTTGEINWPKTLVQKQYDQFRIPLDSIFQKRAQEGGLSGDDYMESSTAISGWIAALAKQRKVYPPNVLDQMARFIRGLERELNDNIG